MSNILVEYLTNIWYVGDWLPDRYNTYNNYVKEFESKLSESYPLGEDSFRINHGNNYFTFFRQLGEPFYYIIFDKTSHESFGSKSSGFKSFGSKSSGFKTNTDVVIGTVAYIYRIIGSHHIMYLCDLKFDKSKRGNGIMYQMLCRTIPTCILRANKFYAISMNNGQKNKILTMGQHIGKKYNIKIKSGGILNIYSLDYDQMCFVHDLISYYKLRISESNNKMTYISLRGIKDLIINKKSVSQTEVMKLLHVYYVDTDNKSLKYQIPEYNDPQKGYTHMFCTMANSLLASDLEKYGIIPSSDSTIIHYNMDNFNWEIIQTSDI
jgi:hypothetical protein